MPRLISNTDDFSSTISTGLVFQVLEMHFVLENKYFSQEYFGIFPLFSVGITMYITELIVTHYTS